MTAARRLRSRVAAALLALASAWAEAHGHSQWVEDSYADRLDRIERRAPLWPEAEALLQPLAAEAERDAESRRAWHFTRGLIAAGLSDDTQVEAALTALRRSTDDVAAPAGRGASAAAATAATLDRSAALALEAQGAYLKLQSLDALRAGREALQGLATDCGLSVERPEIAPGPSAGRPAAGCDYRVAWQSLWVLGREARRRRTPEQSVESMRAAAALALRAGDDWRRALALGDLAIALAESGKAEAARQALEQAQRAARPLEDAALLAQLRLDEVQLPREDRYGAGRRRLLEESLGLARAAANQPVEIMALGFLSDHDVKAGKPSSALVWIDAALPMVRQRGMRRVEAILTNNAGLAHIALGRPAEGRAEMERAITLKRALGARLDEVHTLREYGEAFLAAGDARTALALYHRERALSRDIDQADRERALQDLTSRYDTELRQRRIELLQSENALKTAELGNRELRERVWAIGVATLTLAAALAALLYWRVREANRELSRSQVSLRRQSERDPLTGLANRRHFHALMQQRAREGGVLRGYEGALLLLDIDHFKAINDRHGHAGGDAVLTEVARRLALAVREEDLLARWGGEEFLVATRKLSPTQLSALAERLLHAVGDAPVELPGSGALLRLTASIGHASLPLPGRGATPARPIGWERGLKLADAALFLAKRQGRNRAVALVDLRSDDEASVRAIESDLEAAVAEGHVTVSTLLGPEQPQPPQPTTTSLRFA